MKVKIKTRAFDATVNVNHTAIKVFAGAIAALVILALFGSSNASIALFVKLGFVFVGICSLACLLTPFHYEQVNEEVVETTEAKPKKSTTKADASLTERKEKNEPTITNKVLIPANAVSPTQPKTEAETKESVVPDNLPDDWDKLVQAPIVPDDATDVTDNADVELVEDANYDTSEIDALIEQLKHSNEEQK